MNKKSALDLKEDNISRRAAMRKMGLVAFSGATMLLLLNQPGKSQGAETSDTPEDPGDPGDF